MQVKESTRHTENLPLVFTEHFSCMKLCLAVCFSLLVPPLRFTHCSEMYGTKFVLFVCADRLVFTYVSVKIELEFSFLAKTELFALS